ARLVQLHFVDPPQAPLVPNNSSFMETDESKAAAQPPKEKTFESNANSIAASELPATGEAPLPSQTGKDRPFVDLETHPHSLQMDGTQPQPSVLPHEPPTRSAAPQPAPLTASEQSALFTARPTPAEEDATARAALRSAD